MTRYVLPDLQYEYGALEPHISGRIMELHHDKHHRSYVEAANQTIEKLLEARDHEEFGQIAGLEQALAFNVSGHVLHSILWQSMMPGGGGEPTGALATDIARDFGTFAHLKMQMNKAAATTMGSGWSALIWDPVARRLGVTQIHDHQSQVMQAGIPLLVIDAWEHAYYLQYQTEKAKYFEAVWYLWNWRDVADRYDAACALDLCLPDVADVGPAEARP